jgi:hypothetical protein
MDTEDPPASVMQAHAAVNAARWAGLPTDPRACPLHLSVFHAAARPMTTPNQRLRRGTLSGIHGSVQAGEATPLRWLAGSQRSCRRRVIQANSALGRGLPGRDGPGWRADRAASVAQHLPAFASSRSQPMQPLLQRYGPLTYRPCARTSLRNNGPPGKTHARNHPCGFT